MNQHKCTECFTVFKQKKNLYAHFRNAHGKNPELGGSLLCPVENCAVKSHKYEGLRKHLATSHSVKCEKEVIQLKSWEEFIEWKQNTETTEHNAYVLSTGSVTLATKERKSYYSCHRSQRSGTKSIQPHKMTRKSPGTKKICKTCPSTIEASKNESGITVVRWKTHWGHFEDTSNVELNLHKLLNSPVDCSLGLVTDNLDAECSSATVDSAYHKDLSDTKKTKTSQISHRNTAVNESSDSATEISLCGSLASVDQVENVNMKNVRLNIDPSKKAYINISSINQNKMYDKLDLIKDCISKNQLTVTQFNYLNKILDQCLDFCLQAQSC